MALCNAVTDSADAPRCLGDGRSSAGCAAPTCKGLHRNVRSMPAGLLPALIPRAAEQRSCRPICRPPCLQRLEGTAGRAQAERSRLGAAPAGLGACGGAHVSQRAAQPVLHQPALLSAGLCCALPRPSAACLPACACSLSLCTLAFHCCLACQASANSHRAVE